jgi:hypothetical protein
MQVALASDYAGASESYRNILEVINIVFTVAFLIEMSMKFIGLGPADYVADRFNLFDTLVNFTSLMELLFFGGESEVSAVFIFRV